MDAFALGAAFVAGLLAFFSPYVLPLIPGYLSYISGLSFDEMRGIGGEGARGVAVAPPSEARRRLVTASVAFCVGFSGVFVILGATAGAIGQSLMDRRVLIERIGGAIVVAFGLHTIGLFRLAWLQRSKRVHARRKPPGALGALLVGLAFAVGWTPCLGPIAMGILTIALTEDSMSQGAWLLGSFSLGLALPFIAFSLVLNRYFDAFIGMRKHYRTLELVSGAFLVALGVLIFTSRLTLVAPWLAA